MMRPRKAAVTGYTSGVGAFQSRRAAALEASRLTKSLTRRCIDAYRTLPSRIRGAWKALIVAIVLIFSLRIQASNKDNVITKQPTPFKPQVCSHQLLNPPLNPEGSVSPPPDGSLKAMDTLWVSHVTCFDIDVVTLQDGTLLAAHPRRLAQALAKVAKTTKTPKIIAEETKIHDNTLKGIHQVLLGGNNVELDSYFPFPLLDTELLPFYAKLVHGTHPFFDKPSLQRLRRGISRKTHDKRRLHGPLLNLDLKQGPYLTKDKLLNIVNTIHQLDLEDYVAICVTPLDENDTNSLDMLTILHEHNLQLASDNDKNEKSIALGLVLRDLVRRDQDVSYIRHLVDKYAASIRLLVPSFKFPVSWYQEIYKDDRKQKTDTDILLKLPMTAWTIDNPEDYEYASQMNVAAVVANRPMEFL